MALQFNYESNHGFTFDGGYLRISVLHIQDGMVNFQYHIYANEQARQNNSIPLTQKTIQKPLVNFSVSYAELYTYLKTLPEFADAQDV